VSEISKSAAGANLLTGHQLRVVWRIVKPPVDVVGLSGDVAAVKLTGDLAAVKLYAHFFTSTLWYFQIGLVNVKSRNLNL
jgi:hypothetical protein